MDIKRRNWICSPGITGRSTLYLEPGNYYVSCHVTMQEGTAHCRVGMESFIEVTEEKSFLSAPNSDFELLFNDSGYHTVGEIKSGENRIRLNLKIDQRK